MNLSLSEAVIAAVSKEHSVTIQQVLAYDKHPRVQEARSLSYWILRNRYGLSFGDIAKAMNRERHTILSVSRRVTNKMMHFPKMVLAVDEIVKNLGAYDEGK